METFGYDFRPWKSDKSIAAGGDILSYIKDTARDYDVGAHIQYGRRVTVIARSSAAALWTLTVTEPDTAGPLKMTCRFLSMCPGYYRYDQDHRPQFAGEVDFKGEIIHPQYWPDTLDYAGKKIVIIGSGATAVTLLPQLAETAAHVTMLQRTPTRTGSNRPPCGGAMKLAAQ